MSFPNIYIYKSVQLHNLLMVLPLINMEDRTELKIRKNTQIYSILQLLKVQSQLKLWQLKAL